MDRADLPSPSIAGAPISWGVCEVPGWGHQLTPDRVLREMKQLGLTATELGPDGFLPAEPQQMASVLAEHSLTAIGGFTPVRLHISDHDPLPEVETVLSRFAATGSTVLVLSADSGLTGYDTRPTLDAGGWALLVDRLDLIDTLARERGVRAVLHPHVGTMVETPDDVKRVLEGSSIALCLDTGHLLIGGTDPAELARQAADRIAHVHAKDVDATKALQVRQGLISYTEGVRQGMYRPLGNGDVDMASIVTHLGRASYAGWYVLEQDTILTGEPEGEGPITDVRTSIDFLRAELGKTA